MISPIIRVATCEYLPDVEFQVNVRLTEEQRSRLLLAGDYSPPGPGLAALINRWNEAQAAYTSAVNANPDLLAQRAIITTCQLLLEQPIDEDRRAKVRQELTAANEAYEAASQADETVCATQAALFACSDEHDALKTQVLSDYYELLSGAFCRAEYPYSDGVSLDLRTAAAARTTMEHPEIDELVKFWLGNVPVALADAEVVNIQSQLKKVALGTTSPPKASGQKAAPST